MPRRPGTTLSRRDRTSAIPVVPFHDGEAVRDALIDRLRSIAGPLDIDPAAAQGSSEEGAARLILGYLDLLKRTQRDSVAWLILVAMFGRYPIEEEVLELRRLAITDDLALVANNVLARHFGSADGNSTTRLEVIRGAAIADIDFSAKSLHNTGIQRVVRNSAPILAARHGVVLAAWTDRGHGLRRLSASELARVGNASASIAAGADAVSEAILVPLEGSLLLTEVPSVERSPGLAALARFSGISVSAIGYDTIPIISRGSVNRREAVKFAKFLAVVKWADSVAAISGAAAGEFRGFVDMLGSQGLVGPRVVECLLPSDAVRPVVVSGRDRPLVAVVGSKEPRKNHVAVLFAAERLWREGLDFELLFVGTYGWDTRLFRRWLKRLRKAGRPVSAPARVGDDGLWRAYAEARFTVFPSLHEGYGLPVAESLSYGTPVITTVYGSTGEIAAGGGCVTVDPRDDEQIVDAMRLLLTDDVVLERLRGEARSREVKSWEQYAAEVWSVVAGGR